MAMSVLFGIRAFKTELNSFMNKKHGFVGLMYLGVNTTLSRLMFLFTVLIKHHS